MVGWKDFLILVMTRSLWMFARLELKWLGEVTQAQRNGNR